MYFPYTLSLEATGASIPKANRDRKIWDTGNKKAITRRRATCVPGAQGKWSERKWGKFSKEINQ